MHARNSLIWWFKLLLWHNWTLKTNSSITIISILSNPSGFPLVSTDIHTRTHWTLFHFFLLILLFPHSICWWRSMYWVYRVFHNGILLLSNGRIFWSITRTYFQWTGTDVNQAVDAFLVIVMTSCVKSTRKLCGMKVMTDRSQICRTSTGTYHVACMSLAMKESCMSKG